jgi:uncharacterized protein YoxC
MQPLTPLKGLQNLQAIKPLQKERPHTKGVILNEIEVILYSTNLCLYCMRILRDEITVKDRERKLKQLAHEISNLSSLISQKDFYHHSTYTKQNTKSFFKSVGLRPHHIAH